MVSSRSLWLLLAVLLGVGCTDSTSTTTTQPPVDHSGPKYHYYFLAEHMRFLGADGTYVAWFRYTGDSTYTQRLPLAAFFRGLGDSLKYQGDLDLTHGLDSLQEILISVEHDSTTAPTTPLAKGEWNGTQAFLDAQNVFGDLTAASASITFATRSTDTTRAQHEFYLMTLKGGKPAPGILNLPNSAAGWRYALWVIDSSFYPQHLFYYGSFLTPNGPDFDTTAGDYPFPGGYASPALNDPGAQILLTLEPEWRFAGSRPQHPFPFNVMEYQLKRFISNGETDTMMNTASSSMVHGFFQIVKR